MVAGKKQYIRRRSTTRHAIFLSFPTDSCYYVLCWFKSLQTMLFDFCALSSEKDD